MTTPASDGRRSAVADRAGDRGIEATRTIVREPAHEVVPEHADDEDVDRLVTGIESKTNLERLVVGNVSQRMVPNASGPVMTVRMIDEADVRSVAAGECDDRYDVSSSP